MSNFTRKNMTKMRKNKGNKKNLATFNKTSMNNLMMRAIVRIIWMDCSMNMELITS